MRWFCLCFLLANGMYAVMHVYMASPKRAVVVEAAPENRNYGAKIRLLEELTKKELELLLGATEAATREKVNKKKLFCKHIGPFGLTNGEQFISRLAALEIEATLNPVLISKEVEYMLYLEPKGSQGEVVKVLSDLQENNIDSFVIAGGELANGISLGVFKHKRLAVDLRSRLREKGYAVKMKSLLRKEKEMWAVFTPQSSNLFSHRLWQKIHDKEPELQLRSKVCQSSSI